MPDTAPSPALSELANAVRSHERAVALQQAAYDAALAVERNPSHSAWMDARREFWARNAGVQGTSAAVSKAYLAVLPDDKPDLVRVGHALYAMATDGTFFRYDLAGANVLDVEPG